ncbi:MAG: glycosyltransferase family 9 protein [Desulfobaccales bacterium]
MESNPLPPPQAVGRILLWHQGALGDLLLAGPALLAVRRRYPRARLTGLGQPQPWGLLSHTLSLEAVWDSGESRWAPLLASAPLPPELRVRLAGFQLALVFTPKPDSPVLAGLRQAGIPEVAWVPSFPEAGSEPVAALQARYLAGLGLTVDSSFRLVLPPDAEREAVLPEAENWLAVAPGSGHAKKNWPLSHYYEVSRALSWQYRLRVVWLAGPAEAPLMAYLLPLAAAQGQVLLKDAPLARVAAALRSCRLFLGNDSGLSHLAAALGGPRVLALFGPTDPEVWAPAGAGVRILRGPCPQSPCARGREISCPQPRCLEDLSPAAVLEIAGAILSSG